MLTATITNLSSTNAIGPGTASDSLYTNEYDIVGGNAFYPTLLPGCFAWMNIPASGDVTPVCRVQDLLASASPLSGFTVADELQKMVQLGLISISFANLAATLSNDVGGDAVAAQTT
jgi:hypothetical protein